MSTLHENMADICSKRSSEQNLKEQRYKDASKKQLMKIIETKIRNSFIGPLSYFEKYFGYLWGHGKKDFELTEQEAHFALIWNSLRDEILNNGNKQIRAVYNELAQYTVYWNRHNLPLILKKD